MAVGVPDYCFGYPFTSFITDKYVLQAFTKLMTATTMCVGLLTADNRFQSETIKQGINRWNFICLHFCGVNCLCRVSGDSWNLMRILNA